MKNHRNTVEYCQNRQAGGSPLMVRVLQMQTLLLTAR